MAAPVGGGEGKDERWSVSGETIEQAYALCDESAVVSTCADIFLANACSGGLSVHALDTDNTPLHPTVLMDSRDTDDVWSPLAADIARALVVTGFGVIVLAKQKKKRSAPPGTGAGSGVPDATVRLATKDERVPYVPEPGSFSIEWRVVAGQRHYTVLDRNSWAPMKNARVVVMHHPTKDGRLTSPVERARNAAEQLDTLYACFTLAETQRCTQPMLLARVPEKGASGTGGGNLSGDTIYTWMGTEFDDPVSSHRVEKNSQQAQAIERTKKAYAQLESLTGARGKAKDGAHSKSPLEAEDSEWLLHGVRSRTVFLPDGYDTVSGGNQAQTSALLVPMIETHTMRIAGSFGIPRELIYGAQGQRVVSQVNMIMQTMRAKIEFLRRHVYALIEPAIAVYYQNHILDLFGPGLPQSGGETDATAEREPTAAAGRHLSDIVVRFNSVTVVDLEEMLQLVDTGILDEERALHYLLRMYSFRETDAMDGPASLIDRKRKRVAGDGTGTESEPGPGPGPRPPKRAKREADKE